jgi:hypothetical protein
MRGVIAIAVLIMGVVACAPTESESPTTTADAVTTTAEKVVATTVEVTTTIAADAVPSDLAGSWRTPYDHPEFDESCLNLNKNFYNAHFCGFSGGGGTVSVSGDTITFVSSMLACPDGVGVYRWQVEGDSLTFTELDPPDACPDRRDKLVGRTYTR